MNNGFTEQAQVALRFAHEIVQQKRHSQLDVEHILLALLKPRDGLVNQLIVALGGDPALLVRRLDEALNASPRLYSGYGGVTTNIHISQRAQRVVSEAAKEAGSMDDEFIGVEHLFLAIAGERGGVAAHLLSEMNIDKDRISTALREHRTIADIGVQGRLDRLSRLAQELQSEIAALRRELAERSATDNVE